MTKRQENREKMEQKIFDAAIDLFCDMGYQKTTLIDIAAEAEVSTRTLYKYFPTKESILRKFTQENILALRDFASKLPLDLPLEEKVIQTMVMDCKMMFGLFDITYILHSARDDTGVYSRFEMRNVLSTEAIYCMMFKQEQLQRGITPNENVALCASIVMALYRHCNDLYRFRYKGSLDESHLRSFFCAYVDGVWPSIDAMLQQAPTKGAKLVSEGQSLFVSAS